MRRSGNLLGYKDLSHTTNPSPPTVPLSALSRLDARRHAEPGFLLFFCLYRIAICYILIPDCYMTIAEKVRYLRVVEGQLRGLDREMTQKELVQAIKREMHS